jgi:hypothetical protein
LLKATSLLNRVVAYLDIAANGDPEPT